MNTSAFHGPNHASQGCSNDVALVLRQPMAACGGAAASRIKLPTQPGPQCRVSTDAYTALSASGTSKLLPSNTPSGGTSSCHVRPRRTLGLPGWSNGVTVI